MLRLFRVITQNMLGKPHFAHWKCGVAYSKGFFLYLNLKARKNSFLQFHAITPYFFQASYCDFGYLWAFIYKYQHKCKVIPPHPQNVLGKPHFAPWNCGVAYSKGFFLWLNSKTRKKVVHPVSHFQSALFSGIILRFDCLWAAIYKYQHICKFIHQVQNDLGKNRGKKVHVFHCNWF